jgi:uncharacterized repeat protein (TIGR01451 family)
LFLLLSLVLVGPIIPADAAPQAWIGQQTPVVQAVVVTLATLIVTGLLHNLNTLIFRFYEGYTWRRSLVGRWRTRRHRRRFDALQERWERSIQLIYALEERVESQVEVQDPRPAVRPITQPESVIAEGEVAGRRLNEEFPLDRDSVLPTRLGNVIRSFEDYPSRQYGMSGIPLWPRLIASIDKEYATVIEDAKIAVDFLLNGSVLSICLATALLMAGLVYLTPVGSPLWTLTWLIEVSTFVILAYWLYRASIAPAMSWGMLVKGAFDLYRGALLKQLGYAHVPADSDEERAIWTLISERIVFGRGFRVWPAAYAPRQTFARSASDLTPLAWLRGVSAPAKDGGFTVTLRVSNEGNQRAQDVIVTDTLPSGFEYQWGTARCLSGRPPRQVTGSNPYRFHLGELDAPPLPNEAVVAYRAVPVTRGT